MTTHSTAQVTAPRCMVAWAGDKRSEDALKLGEVLARTFGAGLEATLADLTTPSTCACASGSHSP